MLVPTFLLAYAPAPLMVTTSPVTTPIGVPDKPAMVVVPSYTLLMVGVGAKNLVVTVCEPTTFTELLKFTPLDNTTLLGSAFH
ncbi:hypothetical protein LINBF2_13030 [Limnohabitans sp. INBF002]|nr:hypothetical protein LINBF2_13030 [Limnohabitans sp. INBF002]